VVTIPGLAQLGSHARTDAPRRGRTVPPWAIVSAGLTPILLTGALLLVGGCHLVTAAGLGAIRVPARVVLILAGLSSIGIAMSPEPVAGFTPQHLAWTSFGAVVITVWPAFAARPGSPQPLILSRRVVLWRHAARTRRPELPRRATRSLPRAGADDGALTTGALRGQRDLA
jgi:hypothetical protein